MENLDHVRECMSSLAWCPAVIKNVRSYPVIRGFHKLDKIGNNANIGIKGFTT